ncbi:poly-gamma-glutamate hydrolase family protein [Bradyrhizobium sp. LHD-71]|uniref:poly-gamma-glutamate hydrolase family protein n=1 Tax=Bradyrhizobium sp. LHD-71 TaxID=3072141 RepID=UPI00280C7CC9|nr:poly-gamma-glutamate hydrolase family protein [Bradyrhizobium sp. LHD-71]MDQ8730649.1 poly-gamma-glutamate hydrolase family protein [Bradyrhizobium sp. LHD-71]
MTGDRYRSFAALKASEREGIDYRIVVVDRRAPVTVIAPHGGRIEPPTSRLALAIAGETCNAYCFEGLQPDREHHDLHITSDNFDEPIACELVARSDVVVAVHGRLDRDDPEAVWLGGLDVDLCNRVADALRRAGFGTLTEGHMFPGSGPRNICNCGLRRMGVQLELPRGLRDVLAREESDFERFVTAVRSGIGLI